MQNSALIWDQISAAGSQDVRIVYKVYYIQNQNCLMKYLMPSGGCIHLGYMDPKLLADGTILYNCILLDTTKEVKNENY
jgi:hypothetical protein